MSFAKNMIYGLGALAAIGVIATTQQQNNEKKAAAAAVTPEQKAETTKQDLQIKSAAAGAVMLKSSMKDPEAFELKSLLMSKGGYFCYSYRAKNSYGAVMPSSAVMTPAGEMLFEEKKAKDFYRHWNKECTASGGKEIADFVNRRILR